MKYKLTRRELRAAILDTVPVLSGYLVLGLGFGMILRTRGYGPGWALLMSGLIYAGSLQYVAIDLMTGGASLVTTALTALAVNARHLFYGLSMLDRYRGTGAKKPYLIFALTDETYSLVCRDKLPVPEEKRTAYSMTVSLLDHFYWMSGSLLGALLGSVLPFSTEGVDFALTALFLTVVVEQWLGTGQHRYALTGFGASLACLLIFGGDSFLIPAMALMLALLALLHKKEVRHE